MPFLSYTYPLESEQATTFPPNSCTFSMVYMETFPEPETTHVFPSMVSLRTFNISLTKNTEPYPVASFLRRDPPQSNPFPVITPASYRLVIRLYCPNI